MKVLDPVIDTEGPTQNLNWIRHLCTFSTDCKWVERLLVKLVRTWTHLHPLVCHSRVFLVSIEIKVSVCTVTICQKFVLTKWGGTICHVNSEGLGEWILHSFSQMSLSHLYCYCTHCWFVHLLLSKYEFCWTICTWMYGLFLLKSSVCYL